MAGEENAPGTPIRAERKTEKTLEELITRFARETSKKAYNPCCVQFEDGSFEGEIRFLINVNYEPPTPLQAFTRGQVILIPKMAFQVGVLISQSRIQVDRAINFDFALSVADCIRTT